MRLSPLETFFPLYYEMRQRIGFMYYVFRFFQLCIFLGQTMTIAIFSDSPLKCLKNENLFLKLFLLIQWYLKEESCLYQTCIIFIIQMFWLFSFGIVYFVYKRTRYVRDSYFKLLLYLQVFFSCPVPYVLYFRISLIADIFIDRGFTSSGIFAISALNILTLVINFFILYLNSIFIEPFCLIEESMFDLYTGKKRIWYHFGVFIQTSLSFMIFSIGKVHDMFVFIIVVSLLIYLFSVAWISNKSLTHISFFNNLIEKSALFVTPLLALLRKYSNFSFLIELILYLALLVLFGLVLYFFDRSLTLRVLKIAEHDGNCLEKSSYSFLRKCTEVKPSEELFAQLVELQGSRGKRRASVLIEAFRVLCCYPGQRTRVLDELELTNAKSVHNRFILYVQEKILKAYETTVFPKDIMFSLTKEKESYLSCSQAYWICRKLRLRCSLFKYAMLTYVHYSRLLTDIERYVRLYPFSVEIRVLYIQILLTGSHNTDNIQKQMDIMRALANGNKITDPLLHKKVSTHPQIVSYLDSKYKERASASVTVKLKTPSKELPVWTHLTTKFGVKTYFFFIIYFFVYVSFSFYINQMISAETFYSSVEEAINDTANEIVSNFLTSSSAIFIPFSIYKLYDNPNANNNTALNCKVYILDSFFGLFEQYNNRDEIVTLVKHATPVMIDLFTDLNQTDECQMLDYYIEESSNITFDYLDNATTGINELQEYLNQMKNYYYSTISISILYYLLSFLMTFISILFLILLLYCIFSKSLKGYEVFFDFMSSNQRYDCIRNNDAEQSWEFLRRNYDYGGYDHPLLNNSKESFFSVIGQSFEFIWTFVLFPSFLYFIIYLFLFIGNSDKYKEILVLFNSMDDIYYSISDLTELQNYVNNHLLGNVINTSNAKDLISDILSSDNEISRALTQEIEVDFNKTSVYDLLINLLNINITELDKQSVVQLREYFAPVYYNFSIYCMNDIYANKARLDPNNDYTSAKITLSINILIILVYIIFWCIYNTYQKLMGISNVFYSFPYNYVDLMLTKNNNINEDKINTNFLIKIRVLIKTGKIYSVSSNATTLLAYRHDIINEHFDNLFVSSNPAVDGTDFQMYEFKSTSKSLVLLDYKVDQYLKTYIFAINVSDIIEYVSNSKSTFVPAKHLMAYYPDQFHLGERSYIKVNPCYYIFLRFGISPESTSPYFMNCMENLVLFQHTFKCLNIIKTDGSMAVCNCTKDLLPHEAVILLRALYINFKKKGHLIRSSIITKFGELEWELCCHPDAYIKNQTLESMESVLLHIQDSMVAMDANMVNSLTNVPSDQTLVIPQLKDYVIISENQLVNCF